MPLSAAAADLSAFAAASGTPGLGRGRRLRQLRHSDADLLMPDVSFVPFWVDGAGYCLVLFGDPLLNNPALVELLWGIKEAGTRFQAQAA
jgi:hypothetical protein